MNRKTPAALLVLAFLVLPTVNAIYVTDKKEQHIEKPLWFFRFDSYLEIEVEDVAEPVPIDQSVSIPTTVKYWTNIPEDFLWFLPWWIRNLILYGQVIKPLQMIHLEIINEPEWGKFFITAPTLFVDIPTGSDVEEANTSIIISVSIDAPAVPYSLRVEASCDKIGRINGCKCSETFEFIPEWIPSFKVIPDQTVVLTPPNQVTEVGINITNEGNGWGNVASEVVTVLEGWSAGINPSNIRVDVNETERVVLSLKPPLCFQGFQNIELLFTPYRPYAKIGTPIYLRILAYYP
jgi:hypothetical protein